MPRQTLLVAPPVPDEVQALARARQLGEHTATYRPQALRRRVALAYALGGVVLLLSAPLFALIRLWPVGLACAALGVLCLYQLARKPATASRYAAKRVDVFRHGFIESDHTGPRADFRWDAVTSVYQRICPTYTTGIWAGTTYLYTVTRGDGVQVKLTQFYQGIAALGETIAREVTRVQVPRAMAAIARGETVRFGDVAVDATGVACPRRGRTPWGEIERVQVNRGCVALRRAGRWRTWSGKPASQVPNLFVFLTVADLLLHDARPAERRL
ncbi:MAG TPA: DUF6585 family protein [Rugosimonospora sp.]|nr:DUF6585 family protein [Rugosimonospora sp.]